MIAKFQVGEVVSLLPKQAAIGQVYNKVAPVALKAGILLPEPQIGAGYIQWRLPGDGWKSYATCDEATKDVIAPQYNERLSALEKALAGSPLKDASYVPSTKQIFYRQANGGWEIALVAWGHRYPNIFPTKELETRISRDLLQSVSIGFQWNTELIPNFNFRLENQPRVTFIDGMFYVDGKLKVGKRLKVETEFGQSYELIVTQGQEQYVYDLTQYATVVVNVVRGTAPLADAKCDVSFDNKHYEITTDANGLASLKFPLIGDGNGLPIQVQPVCQVICCGKTQTQTLQANDILYFNFSFNSPEETPQPPHPQPPHPQPPHPEPLPSPAPPKELVTIKLLDYGGEPMPDLPFTLKTKLKGVVQLRTTAEGICEVPKTWFTHKEKMRIKIDIPQEYADTHDLHDPRKK